MQGKSFRDYIRKVQEQGITYRECLTALGLPTR